MAEHVTSDQCETRRLHCGEAMVNSMRRQETQFNGFLVRLQDELKPVAKLAIETDARSKSNTHRLNWAWRILGSVIVALAVAGIVAVVRAL